MIIVEDTRQNIGKHKLLNMEMTDMGCKVIRSKLVVGDYTLLDNQTICIDTKKDILEISGNICGKQHQRFREECERAKECGIKLIILIEEIPPNRDLNLWEHKRTKVKGRTLKKAMLTMSEKYGVKFVLCDKTQTAKLIVRYLTEEKK